MKKRFLAAAMASVMALSLAACSDGSASGSAAAPSETEKTAEASKEEAKTEDAGESGAEKEPITLNIAYMPNYGSLWSVAAAQAQGYMEEEGITRNPAPSISAISARAPISFASTVRQRSLHCPIFPMETLSSAARK